MTIAGSFANGMQLWNPNLGIEYTGAFSTNGHTLVINVLESINSTFIASGSNDNTIKLWSFVNSPPVCLLTIAANSYVYSLKVINNNYIAAGMNGRTGNLCIYSMSTGALIATLPAHTSDVNSLQLLSNGNLVSGSIDNYINIWNTASFTLINSINTGTNVNSLKLLSNGYLAAGIGINIRIYDMNSLGLIASLVGHSSIIRCMILLPNNDLVSGSSDMTVRIWDTTTYALKGTINAHANDVYSLRYISDNIFASGSNDKLVKLWDSSSLSLFASINTNIVNYAIETLSIN